MYTGKEREVHVLHSQYHGMEVGLRGLLTLIFSKFNEDLGCYTHDTYFTTLSTAILNSLKGKHLTLYICAAFKLCYLRTEGKHSVGLI